jgi:hypothetical protein
MRTRWALVAVPIATILVVCTVACSSGGESNSSAARPEGTGQSVPGGTTSPRQRPQPRRVPTVTVPQVEGKGIQAIATTQDLASVGYVREEYFFEGTAVGNTPTGELASNGIWKLNENGSEAYKTRMVVIRPRDAARFDGTAFVEWFNVTGGVDAGATWIGAHNQIIRSGAAWVGVTAQSVGVNGGVPAVQSDSIDIPAGGLSTSDPQRYGSLKHPGDLYSYDIFTQAGVAIRGQGSGPPPLGDLKVERIIAMGESQSAGRLTTYVNGVHPLVDEYDGYLIYSRGSTSAPLGDRQTGSSGPAIPPVVQIRADLDVPVFTFETEYDVDVLKFVDARQANSAAFRSWEVAGTSHQDSYSAGGYALTDLGNGAAEAGVLDPSKANGGIINCTKPLNAGAQYPVLSAALAHLERWVRDGTPPPEFGLIETTGNGDSAQIVRDDLGNARGGIRTPIVDVPLATNIGDASNTPAFCSVFGHTEPFETQTLTRLYPRGSTDYVNAFTRAADRAVQAGIWPKEEAENFKAAARNIQFK